MKRICRILRIFYPKRAACVRSGKFHATLRAFPTVAVLLSLSDAFGQQQMSPLNPAFPLPPQAPNATPSGNSSQPLSTLDVTGAVPSAQSNDRNGATQWSYIDLPSALRLAGAQNGDLVIAYQRTLEATALQQLAAARLLPNLNGGGNYDAHNGALQQANGNILNVSRNALYLGAGAGAVAAGTVGVPGVQYNLNVSDSIFNFLVNGALNERSRFLAQAANNDIQLQVADAYGELLRAQGRWAIVQQSRDDAAEVARVTANFARVGQGRDAEAERAATEFERRAADLLESQAVVTNASARLVELLNLQTGVRLRTAEAWVVPRPIVPDPIPLGELIATAVYRRPELAAQRAAIHAALLQLQAAKILPFSPQILAGYSGGIFGGGSNVVAGNPTGNNAPPGTPRFGDFAPRADLDAAMYWSLQNLGVGNHAMIQTARTRMRAADLEQLVELNRVRAEVADAYARKQTALAMLPLRQQAVESSMAAFDQDLRRVRAAEGRPIEVLESLRLLYQARENYVNTIVDYNEAQFGLYTAMGQPPADLLSRPAGSGFNPAGEKKSSGRKAVSKNRSRPGLKRSLISRDKPPLWLTRARTVTTVLVLTQILGIGPANIDLPPANGASPGKTEPTPLLSPAAKAIPASVSSGTNPRGFAGPGGIRPANHATDETTAESSRKNPPARPPGEIASVSAAEDLPSLFPMIEVTPIDMASALGMVNIRNPQFLLAQQRIVEAVAMRQLAAAQWLPTINLGTSYDGHTGNLQQSNGNILDVKRNSLYIGAGAVAIAAGTVNIPGLVWNNNPSIALFGYLQSQQAITVRQYASMAERNTMGLRVALNYLDLLSAEGQRSILMQIRSEAAELAQITRAYAKTGQGRDADANRAAAEFVDRSAEALAAEGATMQASARLARLLNLNPALRLHPTDNWVVPHVLVPEAMPLNELLAVAVTQRPELAERQAAIRAAFLALQGAKVLPFSPTVFLGLSGGDFGGGSNLVSQPAGSAPFANGTPRFGSFYSRTDEDAMAYWTLRNIGLGNKAMVDAAASRMRNSDWQRLAVFEQVRMEVANAYVQANVRLAQLITSQQAVAAARDSWVEDIHRIRGNEGLPIEAVNSLRLLTRARLEYLESIVGYNRAQFELYVALGQPPADSLARTQPGLPANATPQPIRSLPQPDQLPPPPVEELEPAKK